MEIKISDELNNIIRYAREEAMRTGSYGIGPDHLFLGMMRQAENEACKVIVNLGVDLDEFKRFIDSHIFTNESIPYSEADKISFSRYAQNVLSITVMEASRLKSPAARPEHLLLALCRPICGSTEWTTAGSWHTCATKGCSVSPAKGRSRKPHRVTTKRRERGLPRATTRPGRSTWKTSVMT